VSAIGHGHRLHLAGSVFGDVALNFGQIGAGRRWVRRVVATGVLAACAHAIAATPVLVLNSLDGNVSIIDQSTWTEVKRIPTGKEPHHLYLTPDNKSFIIANALSDSLTFIDPHTGDVQRTLRDVIDPYQLRFSPDMKWFVTAANRLDHIDIYRWDGQNITLVKRIPTGKIPSHLWIDQKSTTVWTTMQGSDELVTIDLVNQTIKSRIKVGSTPADVFVTPDDKTAFVALTGGDGVEVYDVTGPTPRFIKKIVTAQGAHSFRAMGDKRHVFVSNRASNSISVLDYVDQKLVTTFAAPSGPDDMEITPDGKTMMVASRWAGKLSVIDLQTYKVVRQVKVGKSPHGVWTLEHVPRL